MANTHKVTAECGHGPITVREFGDANSAHAFAHAASRRIPDDEFVIRDGLRYWPYSSVLHFDVVEIKAGG